MKQRKNLIIVAVVLIFGAGYFLTRGNADWRIKNRYPTAMIYRIFRSTRVFGPSPLLIEARFTPPLPMPQLCGKATIR